MCFWNTRCVNAWHIMAGRTRKCSRMNLELKYGKIFVNETFELAGKITSRARRSHKHAAWCWSKAPCVWAIWWLGRLRPAHELGFRLLLTMTLKLLEDQLAFYSSKLGKARRNGQRQERGKAGKTGKGKHGKSKHCPQRDDPTRLSEEAFVKARRRMPLAFWVNLIIILGDQCQEQHRSLLTFHGDRLLAVDGTCIDMANWKRLRDYYGTAKMHATGKASRRMVMLQFLHPLAASLRALPAGRGRGDHCASPGAALGEKRFGSVGRLFLELRPAL